MGKTIFLKQLNNLSSFNRNDLFQAMQSTMPNLTQANFKVRLNQLLAGGEVMRVGRNAYTVCNGNIKEYSYEYSKDTLELVKVIEENYPLLDFRIFELVQLNEFLNHQIAHNTTFVFVEEDLGAFVFDTLKEDYQGKLLINPTVELYHQYWTEDMVVILKMATEAPKGKFEKWHTCIEKLMVDIYCEKILLSTYSIAEQQNIFANIFEHYIVDESRLFRYARRRGVEKTLKNFLKNEAKIDLRLG